MNEGWFQSQPEEVREAIRAAGRAAEEAVFPWGVQNVERANAAWLAAGGQIHSLPPEQQESMMATFAEVGAAQIAGEPEVVAEYDRLVEMLETARGM